MVSYLPGCSSSPLLHGNGSIGKVRPRRKLVKAIGGTQSGSPDVRHLQAIAKPTPQDQEVRVKVHAVSGKAADLHALSGKPFLMRLMGDGFLKPKNQNPRPSAGPAEV